MSDPEEKISKNAVKYALAIMVVAIIVAVAYLAFFTPGEVEPGSRGARTTEDRK